MPAELERLTYVFTIDCDHLGERTANAAYILTLKVSYDCRPAPQHVMSWNLGLIGREAARVAGAPMTVAYGPAGRAANNCITSRQGRYFHTTIKFERPSVPPKTQRIWMWGAARTANPMSFQRYGWPFNC